MLKFTYANVQTCVGQPPRITAGAPLVLFIRKDTNISVKPHEDAPEHCSRVGVEGLAAGYAVVGNMDDIIKQIKKFRGEA